MLDTICVNSQRVFAMSKTIEIKEIRAIYSCQLVRQLSTYGLPAVIEQKNWIYFLSDLPVDEDRETTSIPWVPDTFVGKRARRNICLKNVHGKEYDNRKQISLV